MKEEIIAGLDIGSTNIRLVIGQKVQGFETEEIQIIGAVSVLTMGVSKGNVNSIEDATSSISACLEKAERLVGVPLESVWVSINSPKIKCEKSKGVVVVSKSDGEIDEHDVERAIEAARSMVVPNNYEILHVIPIKFTIDNQEDIKDPIGMSGVRLEVETLIILGLSNQIKNLTKAIYRTGLDIEGLVLSSLAVAETVFDNRQKDLGVALINMGATTTSLSVYEEGNLLHTAILPIGSDHITNDIAIGLRCPINLAERIKIEYGHSESEVFTKKDEVDISQLVKEEKISDNIGLISLKYVAEIVEARVEEIFEKVDEELKKIDRSGMLPAGAVLVGGGSMLQGVVETAKRKLRLPVSLGEAKNVKIAIDRARGPEFLTALGLVAWGGHSLTGSTPNPLKKNLSNAFSKVKGFIGKMMPQ
ncbi:cell division protein FtsA [Candidatus Falkowbacteria bacterium CG10_big_fil_rev_8_21_14_0_10_39_9]|uniref:Cell division protein FtsA n=1 Tax=Candidatus Falkowbacteria bacterium CG10_big_fil_rev_8_21_14_0_10_39_9 TaxID=1974566 RepID=A0A2M6WND9_9BACT|nr:MAG: cell division protein FtsA [Candidatus Falkowbacteria bacterium CG10_big_fil_rev_8_21_14_0_10_39_9]